MDIKCSGCPHCNKDPNKTGVAQIIDGAAYTLMWEMTQDEGKEVIALLADEKNRILFYEACVKYLNESEERIRKKTNK